MTGLFNWKNSTLILHVQKCATLKIDGANNESLLLLTVWLHQNYPVYRGQMMHDLYKASWQKVQLLKVITPKKAKVHFPTLSHLLANLKLVCWWESGKDHTCPSASFFFFTFSSFFPL